MKSEIIFLFVLTLIFLLEGLGLPFGHQAAYFLILALPLFLFSIDKSHSKEIISPKQLTLLGIIFILSSFVSTIFSANKQTSFEKTLLYLTLALLFIYSFNHQEYLRKKIIQFILIFSSLFTIVSLFLRFPFVQSYNFAKNTGLQLVYPAFSTHNHLGDFLALPLIYFFYQILTRGFNRLNLVGIILFMPFVLLSFSRSAYLSLFLTLAVMGLILFRNRQLVLLRLSKLKITIFLAVIGLTLYISVLLSLASMWESTHVDFFSGASEFVNQKLGIGYKSLWGSRDNYFKQALNGVGERALGFGPGNFNLVSLKYTDTPYLVSSSSHNIVLDIMAENGIFGGVVFILILVLLVKSSHKDLIFFLAVALLINFQTDYTHMIYSLLVIFIILVGVNYHESYKSFIKLPRLLSIVLFLLAILMLSSQTAIRYSQNQIASYLYPISFEMQRGLIEKSLSEGDFDRAKILLNYHQFVFPDDPMTTGYLAEKYYFFGEKEKALGYYQKLYREGRFIEPSVARRIYELLREYQGQDKAIEFASDVISFYQKAQYFEIVSFDYKKRMIELLCFEFEGFTCPKEVHLGP